MLTRNGNGAPRGSLPALVMRTGLIRPVNVDQARRDLDTQRIVDETAWATNRTPADVLPPPMPSPVPTMTPVPAPQNPFTTAVALTTTATPPMPLPNAPTADMPMQHSDRHHWHRQHRTHPMAREIQRLHPHANVHGAEPELAADPTGRPVAKFRIASSPPGGSAASMMAHQLCTAARALYQNGIAALPAELVGGPLSALMQGGAVELHFQNGVVVRATP